MKLRAVYVNASLKKDPSESHTQRLLEASAGIMAEAGANVAHIHIARHILPPGVYKDMTEHGWEADEWPELWATIEAADILIVGTPIWLGEESSLCRVLIERLYAMSGELNDKGQSIFYGKVGGCVVTGNEDGIKHVAMTVGFALNHLGYMLPPQADCGWVGEAGPGPSYGDRQDDGGVVGFDNEFTQRNTTIMTWNCIHLARLLKANDGIPNYGNDRKAWDDGERFGFANPPGPVGQARNGRHS
jgi:multimeric flavodoxin WrbA